MKILIADDEAASLKTMELFVKKLGYEPLAANDGLEGYEIWEKERPEMVVTDWNMPRMTGLELVQQIRDNEGDVYTYLVIVTVRDSIEDIVKGMEAGADDYLAKPFNRDELNVRLKAGERALSFQTKDALILGLIKLAETRDAASINRLERIRGCARALAASMRSFPGAPKELTGRFVNDVYRASPLYDLGKIALSSEILKKNAGELTKEELEIYKNHALLGEATLRDAMEKSPNASYLRMAAEMARSHHERWDGSGYPDGLKESAIPLCARIAAVCDFYEDASAGRLDGTPRSREEAAGLINQMSGTAFDPSVVKAFMEVEEKFNEIRLINKN